MLRKGAVKGQKSKSLSQQGRVIVEYVWIGQSPLEMRSKARVYDKKVESLEDVEDWVATFKTEQDQEVILHPVAIFRDPFRGGPNKMVLCETLEPDNREPTKWNTRNVCERVMQEAVDLECLFGIEQEYTIMTKTGWPLGFKAFNYVPKAQGYYYCSVDAQNCIGRVVMEQHLKACLYAGIQIFGTNAEVFPGQWEFQIGTCGGLEAGDHLWMARYILTRIAEQHSLIISYHPKPISGDWNGSGAHTNFSTNKMREEGGISVIMDAIDRLEYSHSKHMQFYGLSNTERLTGHHETASYKHFSSGVGNRGASVRIPTKTMENKKGYIEDRRPAANMDPYMVTSLIVDTVCLDGQFLVDVCGRYREVCTEWEEAVFQKKSYYNILDQSTLGSIIKNIHKFSDASTIESISTQTTLTEL